VLRVALSLVVRVVSYGFSSELQLLSFTCSIEVSEEFRISVQGFGNLKVVRNESAISDIQGTVTTQPAR
jgi:hypothetical protein